MDKIVKYIKTFASNIKGKTQTGLQLARDTGKMYRTEATTGISGFSRTIRREYKEAIPFYLGEERMQKLKKMGYIRRDIMETFWLIKGMLSKLSQVRKILVTAAIGLFFYGPYFHAPFISTANRINTPAISFVIVFLVLMLELKEKLLAHDELAAGRSVQVSLMPPACPEIPGWDVWLYSRPANDVGGDLVDFIRLTDNRFGLTLGDVAGKGLPAALFMVKLQATLRALVTGRDSVAELGKKINFIFHRDSISRSFASLVYMQLEAENGHIKFLNAGHLPPLIVRAGKIIPTAKGNIALGITKTPNYSEKSIDLSTGDYLVIYSDGVTEARAEKGDFFGITRLHTLLENLGNVTAMQVGTKIISAVKEFIGEAPLYDDLSIIVLKRN